MRKLKYEEKISQIMFHEFARDVLKGQKDIEEVLEHGSAEDFLFACNYINNAKPGIYAIEEIEAFRELANKTFAERASRNYPFMDVFGMITKSFANGCTCQYNRFYELCSFKLPNTHMTHAMKAALSMCALLNKGISLKEFNMALQTMDKRSMDCYLYGIKGLKMEDDNEAWVAREIAAWRTVCKHLLDGDVPGAFNVMQRIAKETGCLEDSSRFIQLEKWETGEGNMQKEVLKGNDNGRTMIDASELLDMLYERKKVLAKQEGEDNPDENPFIPNLSEIMAGGRMAETEHMIHYLEKKVGMDS